MSKSLKIASFYLLFLGLAGLGFWLINIHSEVIVQYSQFSSKSVGGRLGVLTRHFVSLMVCVGFLLSAIGLFRHKSWARILGIILLVITIPAEVKDFAWGFARGGHETSPTVPIYLGSLVFMCLWNGMWIYLIKREKDVAA